MLNLLLQSFLRHQAGPGKRAAEKSQGSEARNICRVGCEGNFGFGIAILARIGLICLHGGLTCKYDVVQISEGRNGQFESCKETPENCQTILSRDGWGQFQFKSAVWRPAAICSQAKDQR